MTRAEQAIESMHKLEIASTRIPIDCEEIYILFVNRLVLTALDIVSVYLLAQVNSGWILLINRSKFLEKSVQSVVSRSLGAPPKMWSLSLTRRLQNLELLTNGHWMWDQWCWTGTMYGEFPFHRFDDCEPRSLHESNYKADLRENKCTYISLSLTRVTRNWPAISRKAARSSYLLLIHCLLT